MSIYYVQWIGEYSYQHYYFNEKADQAKTDSERYELLCLAEREKEIYDLCCLNAYVNGEEVAA